MNKLKTSLWALLHRLHYVFLKSDMSYTVVMLGACYVGWGAVLLWVSPGLFSRGPSYTAMSAFAPQWVWGLMFLVTGSLKLLGEGLHDVWSNRLGVALLRSTGALMGTFIWSFIAVMFSRLPGTATGMVIYTVFAVSCILALNRCAPQVWLLLWRGKRGKHGERAHTRGHRKCSGGECSE